jgi:methylthioribose-1-phosphate isomerase
LRGVAWDGALEARRLGLLDQVRLPGEVVYRRIAAVEELCAAIVAQVVHGGTRGGIAHGAHAAPTSTARLASSVTVRTCQPTESHIATSSPVVRASPNSRIHAIAQCFQNMVINAGQA